jgi:glucose-6-phosphate isomerase
MYKQNIDGCMAASIGPAGLATATFDAWMKRAAPGLDQLRRGHRDGSLPLVLLPERRDDIPMIEDRASYHRERADTVVVLGTGGSSLGGQALYALADSGFGPSGDSPKLVFLDNIDPHTFNNLFRSLDLSRTDFIAISKSGGTAETLTQALVCIEALLEGEDEAKIGDHFTIITEPKPSPISALAQHYGMTVLPHDPKVGGRYSALSLVGLLPAAIAGLDPVNIRAGAETVIADLLTGDDCPAAVGAAVQCALGKVKDVKASVLMPYSDRLAMLGQWYCQLWAESLGKQGQGTLPVRAVGTVDQHSQLQLYLDGPRDKLFSIIQTPVAGTGRLVRTALAGKAEGLAYLDGRSMGDLMDVMQRATAETLIATGCPTRVLTLDRVDEAGIGALMMHFFAETIIAAGMLGIDPFDQPAVEQGKVLARQHLSQIAPRH